MINAHFAAATKRPIPPKIKARTINTITAALIKYSFIGCYVRIPGVGQEQTEMGLLLRSRRRTVTDRARSSRDFRIVARRTRVTGVPPGLVDDVASDTIIVPVQEAFLVDSRAASTPPNRWIEVQSARVIGTGTPHVMMVEQRRGSQPLGRLLSTCTFRRAGRVSVSRGRWGSPNERPRNPMRAVRPSPTGAPGRRQATAKSTSAAGTVPPLRPGASDHFQYMLV